MASQSRQKALTGAALVLLCKGFVAHSGCFASSGPSLRGPRGGSGLAQRSAAAESAGSVPSPSEVPRAPSTAAPSSSDGWLGATGLLAAALGAGAVALRRGKRRQQTRDTSLRVAPPPRTYESIYGEEGEPKVPEWIDPQSEKFGVFQEEKFEVPPWLTEGKWRSLPNIRLKTKHIKWYLKYFDKDGNPAFDPQSTYTLNQALDLLMAMQERSPEPGKQSVEIALVMDLDQKFPDQQIRTSIKLPHSTGKEMQVAVFCTPEEEQEVLAMGAVSAGTPLAKDIDAGKIEFDVLIAKPQMMPRLAKLGRILGPLKLMPSPKSGTVVTDYKAAIEEFSAGNTLEVRTSSSGNNGLMRIPVAQLAMGKQKIMDNIKGLWQGLVDKKPPGAKASYFKSCFVKTSRSPAIKISIAEMPKVDLPLEDDDF